MKDTISFSVPGSIAIHELHIGTTLTRFLEFDLEYFAEQCVESYEKSRKTGGEALAKSLALKEYLRNCHPYCAATLKTDFDNVALDCIIDHICLSEDMGLEALWVRYLASTDPYEKAIFERITDYKTGYAINQWTNLVRMRAYASSKASVIYGDDNADIAVHRARALYYDMTFSLAAAKLGFGSSDLPQIRYYSLPLMPEAPRLLKNAANTLEDAMKNEFSGLVKTEPIKGRECVRDQMAGMALSAIRAIKRPDDFELRQFIQMYRALPDSVYEPGGLKAVIDLEFCQLMEKGFYLKPIQNSYIREKYASKKAAADSQPLSVSEPDPPDDPIPVPVPETIPPETLQEQATPVLPATPEPPAPPVLPAADTKPLPPPLTATSGPINVPPLPPIPGSNKPAASQRSAVLQTPSANRAPALGERRPRGRPKGTAKAAVPAEIKAEPETAPTARRAASPLYMPVEQRTKSTAATAPAARAADKAGKDNSGGKVEAIIRMAEDPTRTRTKARSLQEINTRCNLIWTTMNVRMGWSISSEEASAWFRYLTKLRYGIGTGELEPAALDKFLDATLEIFKLLPENA